MKRGYCVVAVSGLHHTLHATAAAFIKCKHRPARDDNIDQSSLKFAERPLGAGTFGEVRSPHVATDPIDTPMFRK